MCKFSTVLAAFDRYEHCTRFFFFNSKLVMRDRILCFNCVHSVERNGLK